MKRYEILHLFARRLGLKVGRAQAILSRLQDDGVVTGGGESKRYPDDMAEPEIATLLIALLAESGIATAASAAREFGALATASGERFDTFLEGLLFGPPQAVRHLMVRRNPAGVSVTVENQHLLFGEPPSRSNASPARIVPGEALTAIASELQGQSAEAADEIAALNGLRRLAQ